MPDYNSRKDDGTQTTPDLASRPTPPIQQDREPSPRAFLSSEDWRADFGGFWNRVHDFFSLHESAPLVTASGTIAVSATLPRSPQFSRAQSLSVSIHALVLALLLAPTLPGFLGPAASGSHSWEKSVSILHYIPKLLPNPEKPTRGGGGGGERNMLPPTVGATPIFSRIQLAPPRVRIEENAKLLVPPSIVGDSQIVIPRPDFPNWGDLNSRFNNDSSGPGSRGGIGTGNHGGIGPGDGAGLGDGKDYGTGGDIPCAGCNGFGTPTCIFCPRVDYTDEAVKAKYEGVIVLLAVITADGRAVDIHVSKGLGLGLDEKAVEQVRNWRFKPALGPDGKPTAVRIPIEVVFHLY